MGWFLQFINVIQGGLTLTPVEMRNVIHESVPIVSGRELKKHPKHVSIRIGKNNLVMLSPFCF